MSDCSFAGEGSASARMRTGRLVPRTLHSTTAIMVSIGGNSGALYSRAGGAASGLAVEIGRTCVSTPDSGSGVVRAAQVLIGGEWRAGRTGHHRRIINPATLVPLGEVSECGPEEVAAAVAAARRALPGWSAESPAQRCLPIERAGSAIARHAASLAVLHARETGQVYRESLDVVHAAARSGMEMAQTPDRSPGDGVVIVTAAAEDSLVDWTYTVSRLLARGSTIACLLPPSAPLTILAVAAFFDGLPPGVLNLVPTGSAVVGQLAALEGVDCIVGTAVANTRARQCSVVDVDADLELAAAGVASRRLYRNGQCPERSARVCVDASIADAFTDALHAFMAFLEAGDPAKPATDLGPLESAAAMRNAEDAVGRALKRGARLKLGGRRYQPWGLPGYFLQPTLLVDRGAEAMTADEPGIAAPVIIVCPVADVAAAIGPQACADDKLIISFFGSDPGALRVGDGKGVVVEHVRQRQPDWFPYERRTTAPAAG